MPMLLTAALTVGAVAVTACGGGGTGAAGGGATSGALPSGAVQVPGLLATTLATGIRVTEGGALRAQVTVPEGHQILAPAIAPDGTQVAYVDFVNIAGADGTIGADLHLYVLAGADRVLLEHTAPGEFFWTPRWTADGSAIVYAHQINEGDRAGRSVQLAVERITVASGEVEVLRAQGRDPDLSSDGSLLVFVDDPALLDRLAVRNLATGAETVVADASANLRVFRLPRFSPDGTWIAFMASGEGPSVRDLAAGPRLIANRNGVQDLWLVHPDGTGLRRLTRIQEDQPTFAWSMDGQQILFRGAFAAYLVTVSETPSATIVGSGEFHGWVDWQGTMPAESGTSVAPGSGPEGTARG